VSGRAAARPQRITHSRLTARLYYTDSYLRAFTANVVERAEDGRRIYLDATAFYPTSGGQPFDMGTLGGVPVVDVVDEDERIAHLLASPLPAASGVGATVQGAIDWERRFDLMQQHTGQHLVSAVFAEQYKFPTVSVHFGADYSTLDLGVEAVTHEQIVQAEQLANAIVGEARPVTVSFAEAAGATGLRKHSAREGTLRIVSIEGIDRSACGGTHVRHSGEIGPILLRRQERVRRTARIEFVCGRRALRRARTDYEMLAQMAQSLSVALDEVPGVVSAQGEQLREATTARRTLEQAMQSVRARELYDAASPSESGIRRVVVRRDAGAVDELRALAQPMLALPRVVYVGVSAQPPVVVLAASEDSGIDAGAVLKRALAAAGGRGGGSPRLAQGSVPDADALTRLIDSL